jgi:hypothetical protein
MILSSQGRDPLFLSRLAGFGFIIFIRKMMKTNRDPEDPVNPV